MANSFPGSGLAYADCFSVGTASPSQIFEVKSPSNDGGLKKYVFKGYDSTGNQNGIALRVFDTQTAVGFADVGADYYGSGGSTTLTFSTRNGGGALTEGMRLTNDGKVGIGNLDPTMILSIKGGKCGDVNEGQGQLLIDGDVAYNAANGTTLCQSGAGSVIVFRGKYDSAANYTGFAGIAGSKENTTDGNYGGNLRFYTRTHGANNPKEWMRITNTGNIGIGTGIPDAKLHICNAVAGNTDNFLIIVQNCCTVSDARAGIAFSNNSQTPSAGGLSGASIQTSNNGIDGTGNLLFGTLASGTNTERMRITYNGNVGIACTSPGSKLTVGGTLTTTDTITSTSGTVSNYLTYTSTTGVIGTQTNHALQIRTNDTERIRVTCTGCIGVNITSPTYTLHVNGTFYAAGSSCEYKTSICEYNTDSCMFMKLKPVTYQYKDEWCHLGKELKSGTQIGLIAEDTAEVFPELAILKEEENEKIVRNVDYEKLTIILLSEVQKLRQEVDQLKNK